MWDMLMTTGFLAPSRAALQSMINTCEDYVTEHYLTFCTNIIPSQSKTKSMVFLKTTRQTATETKSNDAPFHHRSKAALGCH